MCNHLQSAVWQESGRLFKKYLVVLKRITRCSICHNKENTDIGRSSSTVVFRLFLLMSCWTLNPRSAWSPKHKYSHGPTSWLVNCGLIFTEEEGNISWQFLSFHRRHMAANRSEQGTFEHQLSVWWSSQRRLMPRAASSQFGQHWGATATDCIGLEQRDQLRQMCPQGCTLWTVPKLAANGDAWEKGMFGGHSAAKKTTVLKQKWAHLKFMAWGFFAWGDEMSHAVSADGPDGTVK